MCELRHVLRHQGRRACALPVMGLLELELELELGAAVHGFVRGLRFHRTQQTTEEMPLSHNPSLEPVFARGICMQRPESRHHFFVFPSNPCTALDTACCIKPGARARQSDVPVLLVTSSVSILL